MLRNLRPTSVQPKSIMNNLVLVKQPLEKARFSGLRQYLGAMNNLQYNAAI